MNEQYAGQYVVVDGKRPELARFEGTAGQVKSVNMNGRALVEFDRANDRGRYDIELDYLRVVDRPEPNGNGAKSEQPAKKSPKDKAATPTNTEKVEKLSSLELARLEKAAREKLDESAKSADAEQDISGSADPLAS